MPRPLPVPREEIAALLRRGDMTETAIAQKLGVSRPTVHNVRKQLGLPAPPHGSRPKHDSIEDAYRAQAVPTTDGHAEWTGWRTGGNVPMLRHRRHEESAYRVAFRLHHGREPEGVALPMCGMPGCVAGAHVEDRVVRRAKEAARRATTAGRKGPPPNGTRAEIIELLAQGLSSREIARRLRTDPRRVGRIRAELDLPLAARGPAPVESVEAKWRRHARPIGDGHMEWTGSRREGVPVFSRAGENYMARRVAFDIANGRLPEGRVKPGCDYADCVAPAHMEDARMRAQYQAIFGVIAA